MRRSSAVDLLAFPGKTVYYIGWNDKREPFTSAEVRRALALGIDRKEIINTLLFGQGEPATSTVPPWHPLYPKDVPALPYDPTHANALLDSAGWKDSNGDGIRERNGKEFRFTLMTSDNPTNRSVVEMVQSQLRKIGVNAQIRVLEFQTLLAQHKARDFDAVFGNWVLDNFQMASAPAALFSSKLANVPKSTNRSGVSITALDRLIEQAQAATTNEKAAPIYRDMTILLEEQQPITFMFWKKELSAVTKDMSGVVMDPRGNLVSINKWSMSAK